MKKVVIVGVGALGSHVAQLLRNEADLRLVDFDRLEQKNILAQFHARAHVGRNKAESAKKTLDFLFSTKVEAIPHKLVDDNALQLLQGTELIIDCLDNGASRRIVQAHARTFKVPCLHGALAPAASFGRVVWDEGFVVDDESADGEATCEGGEHLPFIAIVSAFVARSSQMFLEDGTKVGWQVHPGGATRI